MTRPVRMVDAHVHLWDPANAEWYPYLAGQRDLGMGDTTGMARRFTPTCTGPRPRAGTSRS
ncbi:MAG: hypothetical protein R2702_15250 [Acidimicrobiales bacterium]